MYQIFKNKFKIGNNSELNLFVQNILYIAENYISYLLLKNRLYFPINIEVKDAAVDVISDLFVLENNVLVKFRSFFLDISQNNKITCEEDYNKYLRGFIYSVVQNNLTSLYKDNDPFTYSIYRNIKESSAKLNIHISVHFTGKFIHLHEDINFYKVIPEREDLLSLIYRNKLSNQIYNIKNFLKTLFDSLSVTEGYETIARVNDVISIIKSIFAREYVSRDGASNLSEHISDKIGVKFLLEDVKFSFVIKLNKYVSKNGLPKYFFECMYNIIDEIINDYSAGNERQSVKNLIEKHFLTKEKNIFYKVQYCLDLFENELIEYLRKEKSIWTNKITY